MGLRQRADLGQVRFGLGKVWMKLRAVAVLPEGILAREPVELTATEHAVLNKISSHAGIVLILCQF